ncbi:MAG: DUF2125 domain-containing protein [Alphaproteobacteria bacterium]|nr:DUF2125 domain-containing protein [Alphaproteobacteria bacterium]MDX5368269.1 DUF2125 domain-containing protein [Alphaproteobacteria bacterium]MDX5463075.1 DUF2125 domain-containing protein [Alphaproteobacteria bacterium]
MRYLVLIGAVVAAIAGYSLYWTLLAERVDTRLDAARGVHGAVAVDYTVEDVGGYPYRLAARIADLAAGAAEGALWAWRVPALTVYLQPWNLSHAIAEAEGAQEIAWNGGPMPFAVTATPGTALASARRDGPHLGRVIVDYRDVALASRDGAVGRIGRAVGEAHPAENGATRPGLRAGVSLEDVEVLNGARDRLPLGPVIRKAAAFLRFEGLARPEDLATLPARLRTGRPVSAELLGLAFDWGPLSVAGTGRLMLDAERRPAGTLSLRIAGHEETLDRLVAAGLLDPQNAANLRTALGMLGALGADPEGRVPVTVHMADGAAYIGPVRVATLPPLF